MKKVAFISTIIGCFLFFSCGGGGGGGDDISPTPVPVNKAPSAPSLSSPTNNLLCIDNVVAFSWTAAIDPDGDAVSYEIQVATNNQFSQNLQSKTVNTTSTSFSLEKGIAYYWRVKATDTKNASSSYSSIYSFYTEGLGESNHLPFAPSLVKPELNSIQQEATASLEWTASDVDNDALTYDVYFGAINPPTTKVAENLSESNFTVDLSTSTNYYWKVVVKDDKGGQTIGQVWNFKTD